MKWTTISLIFAMTFPVLAQNDTGISYNHEAFRLKQQYVYMRPLVENNESDLLDNPKANTKSPVMAGLFSAAVPGSGELYAGSLLKAVMFFGIEVSAWTGRIIYKAKEDEFMEYADNHWLEDRYHDWLELIYGGEIDLNNNGIYGEYEDFKSFEDLNGFTHNLPRTRNSQYYSMIGKYLVQFGPGWDDCLNPMSNTVEREGTWYWNGGSTLNAEHYNDLRHDSDRASEIVSFCSGIIILNHIISAVDASITVIRKNRKIETSMNVFPERYFGENIAMAQLTVNW